MTFNFHHLYILLPTHTLVIAIPYQILPFKIGFCSGAWQKKQYLFKATIIFIKQIISQWEWLPLPISRKTEK